MKIVTASQMAELDHRTVQEEKISEKRLIANAGKAAADWIASRFHPKSRQIWVLAGRGHNGSDALVAAQWLKKRNYTVKIFKAGETQTVSNLQKQIKQIRESKSSVLFVDGLFGTGLNRPLTEPWFSLLTDIRSSDVEVISLDIPSGLHADEGFPLGNSIRARYTLTFGLPKLGLIQERAADDVGELHVLDIGFPKSLTEEIQTPYDLLDAESIAPFFRHRLRSVYKGSLGRVLVLGGSVGLIGAPVLAARAALRTGAGLVNLVVPASIYPVAANLAGPEVMVMPCEDSGNGYFNHLCFSKIQTLLSLSHVVVLGPGMGLHPDARSFIETLLSSVSVPIVLDADGLNLVSNNPSILSRIKSEIIVTPHPGEMGRLVGKSAKEVQEDRFGISSGFAKSHQVTVVLKGARTIIAHPKAVLTSSRKDRVLFSINALAGNPGMAMGGCGDVLSGILGALLARGLSLADAARCGVFLHARAGDLALPDTGGGTASDLIEILPWAQKTFLSEG